jgi:hypothetical protein
MKKMIFAAVLLAAVTVTSVSVLAAAVDVPAAINYQGKLTNPADGKPVQAGVYQIQFRIWNDPTDAAAENLIWGRSFAVHVMTNGVFNLLITDDGTPLTSPPPQTNDLKQAFQGENRYLGLTITHGPSGDITSPEISPRQRMVSSPFAFHAQNATDSIHADEADEAKLAQDSEKLGGTAAAEFYNNDRFDALGLSSDYYKFLGWGNGGIAHAVGFYAYGGRYCIGGIPVDPGVGTKLLIRDEKLRLEQGMVSEGPITPAKGEDSGIRFPDNIGTGTGDKAGLSYFVENGTEDCTLLLYSANDSGDKVRIESSGDVEIKAGGNVKFDGKVFGGISEVHNLITESGTYENTPTCDGFFYVNADNVAYTVYIGPFNWYLRSVHDDDNNINLQSYPVAKGETFKVELNDNFDGMSHLKVYWRPFGQ